MADVGEIARLYASSCSTSVALGDAWLLPQRVVELERAVHDVDEDRRRLLRYRLRWSDVACPMASELPSSVSASTYAPTGQHALRVVVLEGKPKPRTCLELWHHGSLIGRVDGSKLHGKVMAEGGTFGGFGWSACEHRVAYVAECSEPESPPLFAPAPRASGEPEGAASPGQKHWFREDWGEKLSGTDRLGLFIVDFKAMTIKQLPGVPSHITPGQPAFWGEDIVYAGWDAGVRKLGALYCMQRPSALYLAHPGGAASSKHSCLTPGLKIARAARPAPRIDGQGRGSLAFLGSTRGFDTHTGCLELFVLEPTAGAVPRQIVPVVETPKHDGFAGICMDSSLPRQCWGAGAIYFNSFVGSRMTAWRVVPGDSGLGDIAPVQRPAKAEANASCRVLAVSDSAVVLVWSTPCQPERATVRSLKDDGDAVDLPPLGPCAVVAGLPRGPETAVDLRWSVQGVTPSDGGSRFDAVLVEPVQFHKPGIILLLHGGPHSASTTAFDHHIPFLVHSTDCAVLSVNYRGSLGFGKQALESLPGHVGQQDVQDCMDALKAALTTGVFDEGRVAVVGGSHGGFLTAQLIGQHPDVFHAAAMRNPVTNIAALAATSDIPDWAFVEGLGLGSYDFGGRQALTADVLSMMLSRSPIVHVDKVRTPTLVALGMKDRRVPPSQGLDYYHALRAREVPVRLLCYEGELHPLDGPACDADHWVNVAVWFNEHLPPPTMQVPGAPVDLTRASSLGSDGAVRGPR
eukprot:CAMPEP_0204162652 /NCGR_PEP_ID=MMETSP0361-20130328/35732_1 /ASSEMBLY_ACC=CAM_ASM_000343 /TAXON_ID=268821 /ORGANISM="Scrippsiella Hangoei, Strain SHTV-5" /LENGTH=743 /DNA_ID=CAMNT_0051119281 /DNA_START=69 /DNA_END=2297 /DNA_ORIENTATION=-